MPAPLRVLVVEDHPAMQELLRQWLSLLPDLAVVHVATTSAAACEWLDQHPRGWELAVIDLFLQDGHGFEILRRLRDRSAHQHAVLLTSYTREPVREQARRAGADAVFDKASEMQALVEYCRRLQTVAA